MADDWLVCGRKRKLPLPESHATPWLLSSSLSPPHTLPPPPPPPPSPLVFPFVPFFDYSPSPGAIISQEYLPTSLVSRRQTLSVFTVYSDTHLSPELQLPAKNTMSQQQSDIQERIAAARREAEQLKEKIRAKRESSADTSRSYRSPLPIYLGP